MKKLIWTTLLALGYLNAQATIYSFHSGGSGWSGSHWHGGHHFHDHTSFSFSFGYPYYAYSYYPSYYYPNYYSYSYAPPYGYSYYPSYGYYARPNYAVGGTLLGALVGGLIGDANHHHGWEGAGIGAAAGLVLGGLAEHGARVQERNYYSAPAAYAQPNQTISDPPAVNHAPAVPDAPSVASRPVNYRPASAMSSANSLFGR